MIYFNNLKYFQVHLHALDKSDNNLVRRGSIHLNQNQNINLQTTTRDVKVNLDSIDSTPSVSYVFFFFHYI